VWFLRNEVALSFREIPPDIGIVPGRSLLLLLLLLMQIERVMASGAGD